MGVSTHSVADRAVANGLPKTAMVLAAGFGKRMRPLTDEIPKPLIPVLGKTLIDRVFDRLGAAGVQRAVVNVHYFGEQIEAHLAGFSRLSLTFSRETELLETGGGVRKALDVIGDDSFLVVNADVLWLDGVRPMLSRLSEAWNPDEMDALLLMQNTAAASGYEGIGDYFLDPLGQATRRHENEIAPFLFAGVQILHRRLFDNAPNGAFSLNVLYDQAQEAGRLYGLAHDGLFFHVGDPPGLKEAEDRLSQRFMVKPYI
ncbi:MAG: nucleotidyltransferase family protein [Pseudomonadota bacterium]